MKKIVVAMDSMKGCLGSLEASRAIAEGLKQSDPDVEALCVPVADGGEGTAVALSYGIGGFRRMVSTVTGPCGSEIEAEWYIDEQSGTAFIDMASAAGLALIEEFRRNPLHTTTYGVGQLIMEAVGKGASKIMLGLGGSATVDAGLGALQALGLRLFDAKGKELSSPYIGGMHSEVADIEVTDDFKEKFANMRLTLLCDVDAPFTGERGAARVFGPQKGADEEEVKLLEKGMEHIRKLLLDKTRIDLNQVPGSGAAGGVAGGLMALAGAQIKNGASTLLDIIGFDHLLSDIDLIITGEGSSDRQTLMGKLPFEILQRGKRKEIPVWLVAGRVSDEDKLLEAGFVRVIYINSPETIHRSDTDGMNAMNPEVATARLRFIF